MGISERDHPAGGRYCGGSRGFDCIPGDRRHRDGRAGCTLASLVGVSRDGVALLIHDFNRVAYGSWRIFGIFERDGTAGGWNLGGAAALNRVAGNRRGRDAIAGLAGGVLGRISRDRLLLLIHRFNLISHRRRCRWGIFRILKGDRAAGCWNRCGTGAGDGMPGNRGRTDRRPRLARLGVRSEASNCDALVIHCLDRIADIFYGVFGINKLNVTAVDAHINRPSTTDSVAGNGRGINSCARQTAARRRDIPLDWLTLIIHRQDAVVNILLRHCRRDIAALIWIARRIAGVREINIVLPAVRTQANCFGAAVVEGVAVNPGGADGDRIADIAFIDPGRNDRPILIPGDDAIAHFLDNRRARRRFRRFGRLDHGGTAALIGLRPAILLSGQLSKAAVDPLIAAEVVPGTAVDHGAAINLPLCPVTQHRPTHNLAVAAGAIPYGNAIARDILNRDDTAQLLTGIFTR